MTIDLKNLTPKQLAAWRMRYHYGWRLAKIALEMGTTPPSVSKLLARAQLSAGLPGMRVSIIRTKPRRTRCIYLSQAGGEF